MIGKPDPMVGEMVKAFVSLKDGFTARRRRCAATCWAMPARRLGAAVAPKEIEFVDTLPNTRSGKIMRRLLKARELGLPEGDTSTLETQDRTGTAGGATVTEPSLPVGCCSDMMRVRRMEEKCAELYSAAKIRGFLHLYVGEEAVAAGSMRALTADDAVGGHDVPRARATRCCAASR